MLNLTGHAIFLENNGHGYVFNGNKKKLLVTNLSVITILKLCNGRRTLDDVIDFFDASVQNDVHKVIQELIDLDILVDKNTFIRTPKYEDVTSFFLSLTHCCNLKCHFCLKHNPAEYKELELKQWMEIVDIIDNFNDKEKLIYLSGGEPLIMTQFGELYKYIYQKGIKVVVYSNGTLFNESIYNMLQQYPPIAILLSIDGSNREIHDRQRGVKGTFDKLLATSKKLLMLDKVQVFWQVVVDRNNLTDMENIAKLACELGVKNIHYGLISAIGKGIDNVSKLTSQEMVHFYDNCYEIGIKYKGVLNINLPVQVGKTENGIGDFSSCGIGNMIHINEQGFVSPCYGWEAEQYNVGPISSIDDLKKVDFLEFFNRAVTDYESCSMCGVRNICRGGCKVEIYNLTGDLHGCNEEKKDALEKFILNRMK
ncbi:MAG: radical SAM protein [Acetatifactor sp.]